MKKYLIIVGLAIILLVGYFYQQNRPIQVKGYLVTKKTLPKPLSQLEEWTWEIGSIWLFKLVGLLANCLFKRDNK